MAKQNKKTTAKKSSTKKTTAEKKVEQVIENVVEKANEGTEELKKIDEQLEESKTVVSNEIDKALNGEVSVEKVEQVIENEIKKAEQLKAGVVKTINSPRMTRWWNGSTIL